MAAIKKFFEKRKLNIKLKKAREVHQLNESPSANSTLVFAPVQKLAASHSNNPQAQAARRAAAEAAQAQMEAKQYTKQAVDIILRRENTVQINDWPVSVSRYFDPDVSKSSMKWCRSISAKGKISTVDDDQELPPEYLSDCEDLPEEVKMKSIKDTGKKKATTDIKKQQSVPDEQGKIHNKMSSVVKEITSDSENSEEEPIEEPWKSTIKAKVSVITKTKDFYVMYFEDPRISQGQFYEESFLLDGLNKIIYLTFCDKKAAIDTVHFKHKPESNLQKVEMATEDDFNTHLNLISVHGYYCSTAEQKRELKKKIEDITKMEVMSIVQQDEPRSAIIVFNPDLCEDISAVTWMPFNFGSVRLIVAPVFKTNWVKVIGMHNLCSDDTLQRYMSNTWRSGGGEIISFKRLSNSEACINFKESKSNCFSFKIVTCIAFNSLFANTF